MRVEVLRIVALGALSLDAACAAHVRHTFPEAMSAAAHRRAASAHFASAQEARRMVERREHAPAVGDRVGPPPAWSFHWEVDLWTEEDEGEQHLAAALVLESDYVFACALIEPAEQVGSPFDGLVLGMDRDGDDAVVLHVAASAGPPEVLLHRLRCHRARMAYLGLREMPSCPLGLGGLQVSVRPSAEGLDVRLEVDDARDLPELERRARLAVTGLH